MKHFRIIGLALLALLALGAFAASTASAEEGTLPQLEHKFTIAGGAAELLTLRLENIKCTATTGSGTYGAKTDQKATGTFTFTGCTAEGLAANTLGAASGTITASVNFLVCLVEPKTLVFGVLIEPKEVQHVEIPSVKLLILVKGAVIAELEGAGLEGKEFKFKLENNAKGDQVAALKCEINEKVFNHTFESSLDTKTDIDASEKALATVKFEKVVELMDK